MQIIYTYSFSNSNLAVAYKSHILILASYIVPESTYFVDPGTTFLSENLIKKPNLIIRGK